MRIIIIALFLTACAKSPTADQVNNDLVLPKMACQDVGAEIHCQLISADDLNGVPQGCGYYSEGNRRYLNGELAYAMAYDCGIRNRGLRCFYFTNGELEDVVCQSDYS